MRFGIYRRQEPMQVPLMAEHNVNYSAGERITSVIVFPAKLST
jgi:hypothetical protein